MNRPTERTSLQDEADSVLEWPLDELVETAEKYCRKGWITGSFRDTASDIAAKYRKSGAMSDGQRSALARIVAFVTARDRT